MSINKKLISTIIVLLLLVPTLYSINISALEEPWYNKDFSYRQEIIIPFDTSNPYAKYQPIDTQIIFDNLCFAKNTEEHSIRIIMQKNQVFKELESQIYNLKIIGNNQLESCNIVFLIPDEADGSEKYFVYYDEVAKQNKKYVDHIKVEKSFYSFEPIPGFSFESNFFNIIDDGFSIYQIAYEGGILGKNICHQVSKLNENSKDVTPINGDISAGFDFKYFHHDAETSEDFSASGDNLLSKKVIVDGNLMVQIGITSKSDNDELKTTVYYTYYHCPGSDKRIHIHAKHEITKECKGFDGEVYSDGRFLHIDTGWIKSKTIKELNFGRIFPYVNFRDENGILNEIKFDNDPEYIPPGLTIPVIDTKKDVDLYENPWVSIGEGKIGKSHGIIFDTNNVIKSGSDERNGIQIKAFEWDYPHLPGLESNSAGIVFNRNNYEKGETKDTIIPSDLVIEFYADFYTSSSDGYKAVEEESEIFRELVKIKPSNDIVISSENNKKDENSLTVFIHNSRSYTLGSGLSALTGLNFSYVSIDLFKDNRIVKSGSSSRLDITSIKNNDEKEGFLQKIKSFVTSFNFEDLSFFKKLRFDGLESGKYMVKIFRKNCKYHTDEKLIGFKILDLDSDTKTRVFCTLAGTMSISVFDQNYKPLDGVEYKLEYEGTPILDMLKSENGKIIFSAPAFIKNSYVLKMYYKGIKIYEEPVKFGLKQIFKTELKDHKIDLYSLKIKIVDKLGLKPGVDINPILSYKNSENDYLFSPVNIDERDGIYVFNNLLSEKYNLEISYNTDILNKDLTIGSDEIVDLIFPSEYNLKTSLFDDHGNKIENARIVITRMDKKIEVKNQEKEIKLPPGNYNIKIYNDEELIGKRDVEIIHDTSISLVTKQESTYPMFIIILTIILFLIIGSILFFKKKYNILIKTIAIMICFISLFMPWWSIHGLSENQSIQTSSNMYLTPPGFISITSGEDVISGEISYLPGIFITVLQIITLFLILACILIFINIIIDKYRRKIAFISLISGFVLIINSISIFIFAMMQYSKVSLGSIIGSGNIDVNIAGKSSSISTISSWGFSTGFYILIFSIIAIMFVLCRQYKNELLRIIRFKNKNIINISRKTIPFIGIAIFAYLIYNIGVNNIIQIFMKIPPVNILIILLLLIPSLLITNYQWGIVLKKHKFNISFKKSLEILLVSGFYSSITPGKIGTWIKVYFLKKETKEPYGKCFVNSYIFSAISMMSFFILLFVGSFYLIKKIPIALPIATISLVLFTFICLYFYRRERGENTLKILIKYFIPKTIKPLLQRFIKTFYQDLPKIKDLIIPFLIDVPVMILAYSQLYIVVISLNAGIPYIDFIFLCPIIALITMIPITPGSFGTREITIIYLFSLYGVDPAVSMVISLAGYLFLSVPSIIFGSIIAVIWSKNGKTKPNLSELYRIKKEFRLRKEYIES